MTRFLLPVLPMALAALAGAASLSFTGWRTDRAISLATLGSFLPFGAAALCVSD